MAMNRRPSFMLCGLVLFMLELLIAHMSYAAQSDVYCLKSIQNSFKQLTNSWNFSNETKGFICNFIGIECWNDHENRVLNIKLQDMGLKGQFPLGIVNCTSLTGLNLSGNILDGSIPSNVSKLLPFVTSLDLSKNHFAGSIPTDLSNCAYLNRLMLDHNHLSGQIPTQLTELARLHQFSAVHNDLTGRIPSFSTKFPPDSYAHNPGLCGHPLPPCRKMFFSIYSLIVRCV